MRIRITQELSEPLSLPISYHHVLQGVIYHAIRQIPGYESLHDKGYEYGKRQFRMFTFSELCGKYKIADGRIIFPDRVEFWVSGPDESFIRELAGVIASCGISWGEREPENVTIELVDVSGIGEEIHIRMLSPICVYTTDRTTKETRFYQPGEKRFAQLVSDNFYRKYQAFYGSSPEEGIELNPVLVLPKDKKVVKYKNMYLDGWTGEYRLTGKPEYLEFLHDAGIGSKNSKGFGMFTIL